MTKTTKAKIEDIYPLNDLQQGLLMHHLYQENDQGRIRTECTLNGPLQVDLFKQAWNMAVARHQSLRSSVHWEKVEKPVQVVRPSAEIDWSEKPQNANLSLDKSPQGRWSLEKIGPDMHRFYWDSHHILLDGWSSGVILRDVFAFYDSLVNGDTPSMDSVPTYRNYLNWRKQQDDASAEAYWSDRLSQVEPLLLPEQTMTDAIQYVDREFILDDKKLENLRVFAKASKVTLSTVLQACWYILISKLTGRKDIVYGATVSGRPTEIPKLDQLAGLFAQVLPVRIQSDDSGQAVEIFLQQLQLQLQSDQANGYLGTDRIIRLAKTGSSRLFNSLLIVQNYPWETLSGGQVIVSDYKGDMTTTFPLTVGMVPASDLRISLRYQSGSMPAELIDWMGNSMCQLLEYVSSQDNITLTELKASILTPPSADILIPKSKARKAESGYTSPNNPTELALVKIWEGLLDQRPISPTDDFFELGGTSILAVRLFGRIKSKFDKNLPPITLLENRTVRDLAKLIAKDDVAWTTVVPLKASGDKPPIFCLHAGMGHVFFYHPLAEALDKDRPVYAIQPEGLDGETEVHHTIEEMAAFYLEEIKKVQPEGPYLFLGYCYSTAVCVEMGKRLIEAGEPAPRLLIVDSAPKSAELDQAVSIRMKNKPLIWYLASIKNGKSKRAFDDLAIRFLPERWLSDRLQSQQKVYRLKLRLVPAYENYLWPQYHGDIALFISKEFSQRPATMEQLNNWNVLVTGHVEQIIVEGNHHSLFGKDQIDHLANGIQNYLARVDD
ncbi:MAG: condensation domain-containing protein [Bacteroidota bacterium]